MPEKAKTSIDVSALSIIRATGLLQNIEAAYVLDKRCNKNTGKLCYEDLAGHDTTK